MRDTSTFVCPGQCSLQESSRDLSQVADLLAVSGILVNVRNILDTELQQQASNPPGLEVTSWSSWMRDRLGRRLENCCVSDWAQTGLLDSNEAHVIMRTQRGWAESKNCHARGPAQLACACRSVYLDPELEVEGNIPPKAAWAVGPLWDVSRFLDSS